MTVKLAASPAKPARPNPWDRLMAWTPTEAQLDAMGAAIEAADLLLKITVIAAAFYLAAEIVPAFLSGGAAHRAVEHLR